LRDRPKNKNGSFSGQKPQNFATTWTDLRTVLLDFQGAEWEKRSSPHHLSEKKMCAKNSETFSSGLSVFRGLSEVYLGLRAKCHMFAHFSQNCNVDEFE
jgi:hypothetical protein